MQRRQLLAAVGTAAGFGVLAGCLDETGDLSTDSTDDTDAGPSGGEGSGSDDIGSNGDEIETSWLDTAEYEIGRRENVDFPTNQRPHFVIVENGTDDDRTLTVVIEADEAADEDGLTTMREIEGLPFEGRIELEPGDDVRVVLNEPGNYELSVETDDASVTEPLGSRWFDCNGSSTTVRIDDDGIDVTTVTTLLACAKPEIEAYDLEHVESTCAGSVVGTKTESIDDESSVSDDADTSTADDTTDDASPEPVEGGDHPENVRVTTRDGSVIVDGTIQTPTPCYEPVLESVSYDDGVLTVVVDAVEDGTPVCVQCVGMITYRVTVDFERGFPDSVDVKHGSSK